MSYEPIKKIGSMNSKLKTAQAALKRLDYVMHQKDDTPDAEKPNLFPASIDHISMENLDFAYEDETVLKMKQLHINKEEIVALVGPSGAGKSTFAALLPRFYDPQQGQICFNGVDLKALNKNDLRSHMSIVSQDTVLFDDSVMGNIRLGKPEASDEDVMRAAQAAQAHGFIEGLPNGYETIIGERGTRLSGGQKQRLAIARAFLKDAPILILDEATSALDSESEAKIQQALEELVVGKTVFIIAHRFSTIKLAHRILVFEKGEIVADGSHVELIVDSELYRELHERQEL
jgi:subfamily B ATP-binding cassette protein MsbA